MTIQAVRIVDQSNPPHVGAILPNSWHPAGECDWVEQDTELDGACGFALDTAGDSESLVRALSFAGCQWPGRALIALIEGHRGTAEVPEDGGCTVRAAKVIGLFWWEC